MNASIFVSTICLSLISIAVNLVQTAIMVSEKYRTITVLIMTGGILIYLVYRMWEAGRARRLKEKPMKPMILPRQKCPAIESWLAE